MNNVEFFVKNKFKHSLQGVKYEKYKTMAKVLDLGGSVALIWDENEAFGFQQTILNQLDIDFDSIPRVDDWKEFLADKYINQLLNNLVIQGQNIVFRRFLTQLSTKSNLTPQDMKAIEALNNLIKTGEEMENQVIYVQYIAPVRYGDHDNGAIVEEFNIEEQV